MKKYIRAFPVISGILFLITAVTAVALAWTSDIHKYDLGITFSAYVGLSRFTSALYFISAVIMTVILGLYIVKTKMPLIKRVVYAIVLLCIFGSALFPFNYYSESPTAITIDLHNDFAIALMLAATISFILTAAMSKNKKQRTGAILSIVYAVSFIVLFFIGFEPLFKTIFIWENLFILLLLFEMQSEQYDSNK